MDLFARAPTDIEKLHYREQWGAVAPWRCMVGMLVFGVIGFMIGLSL